MTDLDKDRILRRIKKCLALSKSDNEHEAAAALRQAKRMMDKYGIDATEASAPDYEVHDLSEGKARKSRLTQAERALYSVVARFFGCTLYSDNGWPVIVGVSPAPKIVEYAANVLLRQMRRGYDQVAADIEKQAGRDMGVSFKRKARHSYSVAWAVSVESKVHEFAAAIMPEQKKGHESAVSKHWGMDLSNLKSSAVRGVNVECPVSAFAARAGLRDGQEANLSVAMESEYSPPARLSAVQVHEKK